MSAYAPSLIVDRVNRVMPSTQNSCVAVQNEHSTALSWLWAGVKFLLGGTALGLIVRQLEVALGQMEQLRQKISELIEKVKSFCRGIAMPWILPDYADLWQQISDRYGSVASGIGTNGLRAPGNTQWTGQAATQYQEVARKYTAAAAFGSDTAQAQGDRLDELAMKAQALYMSIGGCIVQLIAIIVKIAMASGTFVGIPKAVATALIEIPPLVVNVFVMLRLLTDLKNSQERALRDIKDSLTQAQEHFPNGAWLPLAKVG